MKWKKILITIVLGVVGILSASAQIGDVVNGLTSVMLPAIQRGSGYKGYVEADYTCGVGNYRANFLTLSTSQGYQLTNWFYIGAGIGVDMLWSKINSGWGNDWIDNNPHWYEHEKTNFAVLIPVFTDFRFIMGNQTDIGFYIELKCGAEFLCSNNYVKIRDGYLTNQNYFYFQPSVGFRIPTCKTRPRQAMDIGVHYRLMTSDYWSNWQRNASLNGFGINVSYEW